jgi:hypothetical protein
MDPLLCISRWVRNQYLRLLLGDIIFISYAGKDAAAHAASSAGLIGNQTRRCFRLWLVLPLRQTESVKEEIDEFLKTDRIIVR